MPGGDRTGPMGAGAMTGRGAGFCAGFGLPGYANPVGRGGAGWGRGRGFRGRGFGRGYGYYGQVGPMPVFTAAEEMNELKQDAQFLQDSLTQVQQRIEQLEKAGDNFGTCRCLRAQQTISQRMAGNYGNGRHR